MYFELKNNNCQQYHLENVLVIEIMFLKFDFKFTEIWSQIKKKTKTNSKKRKKNFENIVA